MLCDVERFDGAARVADCPGALGADEVALPALRLDENGDALGVDVDRLVRVDESFAVVGRKLRREPNRRENVIVILDADLPGEFGRGRADVDLEDARLAVRRVFDSVHGRRPRGDEAREHADSVRRGGVCSDL